jgi:hypothetical protein
MKPFLTIIIYLISFCAVTHAQDTIEFKNYRVLSDSLLPGIDVVKDSFLTKRYTLINETGDSLFLFQNLRCYIEKNVLTVLSLPPVDKDYYAEKGGCYCFTFVKDTITFKDPWYRKYRNVDFLYKGKDGRTMQSTIQNHLIIYNFYQGNCHDTKYDTALNTLLNLLNDNNTDTFKKAVFTVENTYLNNKLSYEQFNKLIRLRALIVMQWLNNNPLKNYRYPDSINYAKNYALFHFLKDTTTILLNKDTLRHLPYTYNFTDFSGRSDWSNMFVTKLMEKHKGNCHSLPYLYKILADELGAACWLGLAPNHMYIKCRDKKDGWYNTELTSGTFPSDSWIMGSGYIPVEAIQSGIYMDTLSRQQSIALCILDLAKCYEHQTNNYDDGFMLKCCELSLQAFPRNIQAMLLKAEILKRQYTAHNTSVIYTEMENNYAQLVSLGYREMPDKMYLSWLKSAISQSRRNKQPD